MFKKIIAAVVFVTVIAAPAFAQSFNPEDGTGNVMPFAYAPTDNSGNNAYARSSANSAYAQAAPKRTASKHRSNAAEMDGTQWPFYGVTGGTDWYSQDSW
jgi:hypothetical protein